MRLDYAKLVRALKERERYSSSAGGLKPSGVTVPLFDREGATHVLFTLRTHKVKHHKGQISFPGGAAEEGDGSILETAIRETTEEVGIPLSHIHVLGPLDDTETVSHFQVTPVVVRLDWPFPTSVCADEIAEVIEIPISDLLAPGKPRVETWDWDGEPLAMYFYDCGPWTVWGATARILRQFLSVAGACVVGQAARERQ